MDATLRRHVRRLALALMLAAAAGPAFGHPDAGLSGGFMAGFSHPLRGLDHLLAMVAVGIWGAFLGRPLAVQLPLIFPTVMVAGAFVGMSGIHWPYAETGIALSVLVLGLCIAAGRRMRARLAWAVVAAFALCHGYGHGRELPAAANPIGYSLGFVLATGFLHLSGIALGLLRHYRAGTLLLRGAGLVIGAVGASFLCGAAIAAPGRAAWILMGLPFVLVALLARWEQIRLGPLPLKVLASWLCAVALLATALHFVPGAIGNMPDHME